MDNFIGRRERLAQTLAQGNLDAFLVTNVVNVSYLSNFSGDSSFLVLGRDRAVLVSDPRYTAQIAEECPGLETHIRPVSQTVYQAAAEVIDKLGFRAVAFEADALTVTEHQMFSGLAKRVNWTGLGGTVEALRVIKDDSEIAQLREAIRIAEKAFTMFTAMLRSDDREKDLHDQMEYYIRRAGGRCGSFPSIIAVGERAALPHAPPTQRPVSDAGLLLIDWGASGRFYKSDLTRVLATHKILPKLEQVYAVVLQAQERAIRRIRPGVKANEVDAEARAVIEQEGFGQFFGHGLGHGLGLQVHEQPAIRQTSQTVLQPGMVFTVEPGIYLPGWGGVRIEDDVLVTPDGCEVLTSVPKTPILEVRW